MRTNVTVIASAVFLALTFGIAHAADNNVPSTTGAAVGTPGSENKGNPIPVPDQATGGSVDKGDYRQSMPPMPLDLIGRALRRTACQRLSDIRMRNSKLSGNTGWRNTCLEGSPYSVDFCRSQRRAEFLDWRFARGLS